MEVPKNLEIWELRPCQDQTVFAEVGLARFFYW